MYLLKGTVSGILLEVSWGEKPRTGFEDGDKNDDK